MSARPDFGGAEPAVLTANGGLVCTLAGDAPVPLQHVPAWGLRAVALLPGQWGAS